MPVGWAALAGGVISAIGSTSAASTQAGAQEQAAQTQLQMFNTLNQQEQPFIQGGYGAENALLYGLGIGSPQSTGAPLSSVMNPGGWTMGRDGRMIQLPQTGGTSTASAPPPGLGFGSLTSQFTPQDFLNNQDPGYQFQLQTGGQAIRNADTPGVGALSGPALKDLMSFNQGMASTGYQNAFNRFTTQQNNIFSRLSAIAGLGQNAATQVGTAGTSLGTGVAQAQAAAGGSLAGGIVGASNSIGNSLMLSSLMNNNSGGGGSSVPSVTGDYSGSVADTYGGGG